MGLLARFREEDPVPVTVRSPRPATEVVEALAAALAVEHLAAAPGGQPILYRLQGAAEGRSVSLRVSASATHTGAWPFYALAGEVHDAGTGSEFRGGLVVPGAASGTWALVLAASAVIGVLLLVGGYPWLLPLWALGFVLLLFAPEIRRRKLRRVARDVAAILASIADG